MTLIKNLTKMGFVLFLNRKVLFSFEMADGSWLRLTARIGEGIIFIVLEQISKMDSHGVTPFAL